MRRFRVRAEGIARLVEVVEAETEEEAEEKALAGTICDFDVDI